ncbi:MAG: tyrosine-type recombinase/integrase [Elusimicrobiota bacterium]
MGTVFRRGDTWYIFYRANGRRYRQAIGPKKSMAEKVLASKVVAIFEGRFFPDKKAPSMSMREFLKKYWDLHARNRKSTLMYYIRALEKEFGDYRLDEITVPIIRKYLNIVRERASIATANRHHTTMQSIFSRAKEWGDFSGDNPFSHIKKEREPAHRLRYLEKDEIPRLLEACEPRIRPVVLCAIHTGMRRGEILGLAWENLDLQRGIIYVLQSKSGKPREIPITPVLREALLTLGPKPSGKVFDVPEITLRRSYIRAMCKAGLAHARFHDLRHTFASHFIMKTQDLPALQRLLGHSTPLMTQRYAHLSHGHQVWNMALFQTAVAAEAATPEPVQTSPQASQAPLQAA